MRGAWAVVGGVTASALAAVALLSGVVGSSGQAQAAAAHTEAAALEAPYVPYGATAPLDVPADAVAAAPEAPHVPAPDPAHAPAPAYVPGGAPASHPAPAPASTYVPGGGGAAPHPPAPARSSRSGGSGPTFAGHDPQDLVAAAERVGHPAVLERSSDGVLQLRGVHGVQRFDAASTFIPAGAPHPAVPSTAVPPPPAAPAHGDAAGDH